MAEICIFVQVYICVFVKPFFFKYTKNPKQLTIAYQF